MNSYRFKVSVDGRSRELSKRASDELIKNAADNPGFFDDKQGLLAALIGGGAGALAGYGIDSIRPVDDEEDAKKRKLKSVLSTSLLGAGAAYGLHNYADLTGDPPAKNVFQRTGEGIVSGAKALAAHPYLVASGTGFATSSDTFMAAAKAAKRGFSFHRNPSGKWWFTRNVPLPRVASGFGNRFNSNLLDYGIRPWFRKPTELERNFIDRLRGKTVTDRFRNSTLTSEELWRAAVNDPDIMKVLDSSGAFNHKFDVGKGPERLVVTKDGKIARIGSGKKTTPLSATELESLAKEFDSAIGNARGVFSEGIRGPKSPKSWWKPWEGGSGPRRSKIRRGVGKGIGLAALIPELLGIFRDRMGSGD